MTEVGPAMLLKSEFGFPPGLIDEDSEDDTTQGWETYSNCSSVDSADGFFNVSWEEDLKGITSTEDSVTPPGTSYT